MRKVKTSSSQVIFWLTDIHPETLHVERVELMVGGDQGEDFFFYRGGSEL